MNLIGPVIITLIFVSVLVFGARVMMKMELEKIRRNRNDNDKLGKKRDRAS